MMHCTCFDLQSSHSTKRTSDVSELATESGSKAILDEAQWHGEDLAKQFASLRGFHEHSFWTFLERPKYWQGALAFHHADMVPFSAQAQEFASQARQRECRKHSPARTESQQLLPQNAGPRRELQGGLLQAQRSGLILRLSGRLCTGERGMGGQGI
jgi:hypothetical protein